MGKVDSRKLLFFIARYVWSCIDLLEKNSFSVDQYSTFAFRRSINPIQLFTVNFKVDQVEWFQNEWVSQNLPDADHKLVFKAPLFYNRLGWLPTSVHGFRLTSLVDATISHHILLNIWKTLNLVDFAEDFCIFPHCYLFVA